MSAPVALTAARYGKDRVRIFRIVRSADGWNDVVEYDVRALLEGAIDTSYTQADNSVIVATDSIKNTIYTFAKASAHVLQPETFALELGLHFVQTYSHITKAFIDIKQPRWRRIKTGPNETLHPHSFVRDGDDKRVVSVEVDASEGKGKIRAKASAGIVDLLVLKSSGSAFEGFIRDKYTTLPEVSDRIFSTSVDLTYTLSLPTGPSFSLDSLSAVDFDGIARSTRTATLEVFALDQSASVQATMYKMAERIIGENAAVRDVTYKLPNKHYIAVDLNYIGLANTKPSEAEVFMPIADPSGYITATISRVGTLGAPKL